MILYFNILSEEGQSFLTIFNRDKIEPLKANNATIDYEEIIFYSLNEILIPIKQIQSI